MPDQQQILLDVYQRLGGIEAKIDDVKSIRVTADEAKLIAQQAYQKAEVIEKDVEEIRSDIAESRRDATSNKRWLIGTVVGGILSMASVVIAMIALFI